MNNFKNKNWWNNNPMTYIDWDFKKKDRIVKQNHDFKILNKKYLDTNPYLKKFFKKLKNKNFLKNKVTLDLGCGWGSSSINLAKYAKKLFAIDISETSIKGAKQNIKFNSKKKIYIKKMDAERLNFKKNYFDYIYSWGVIHHSENPQKIFMGMYNVMKKGGKSFVMIYNKHSLRYYCLGLYYLFAKCKILSGHNLDSVQQFFTDGFYHKHYTKKEIKEILEKIGFNNIKINIDYMAARVFPGVKKNSKLDLYLKKKFGWFLIINFTK